MILDFFLCGTSPVIILSVLAFYLMKTEIDPCLKNFALIVISLHCFLQSNEGKSTNQ
jgi:hypothetical protein